MSNAPKKILMAINRDGEPSFPVNEATRLSYEYECSPWIVETYILESEADKIVRQTYETVVSAREVEKRRRDLFEEVALIHLKQGVEISSTPLVPVYITKDVEWILRESDKFAKGEK